MPDSSFRWDLLRPDPRCHRFQVSVFPASSDLEIRWDGPNGELLRHVEISAGEIVTNVGDARILDENADTDDSLQIDWDQRLPAKVAKQLLGDAADGEVKTYDGRQYVRCDRRSILKRARIVHTDRSGRTWVAVDQTGKINTLRDPLAELRGDIDPDELADQVLETWFRFSMFDTDGFPPVNRYAWPEDPDFVGLAAAVRLIQQDQSEFFALLSAADYDNVNELLQEHYGLDYRDVWALLKEPLLNLLPHREPN